MANVKAGDRCVIVGEIAGCEANIGALVTVTEANPYQLVGQPLEWLFVDATRPLVSTIGMWGTDSFYGNPDGDDFMILFDRHLVPLHGDLTGDTESTDTPIRETA